jgi:hypothetical protein
MSRNKIILLTGKKNKTWGQTFKKFTPRENRAFLTFAHFYAQYLYQLRLNDANR